MDTNDIVKQIDTEISNLQQARAILIGAEASTMARREMVDKAQAKAMYLNIYDRSGCQAVAVPCSNRNMKEFAINRK